MESVRAKILFAESLSDKATPQVKSMILVPRSECLYISSLKEHIRNKFSISEGQRFELSIDGFIIPDWEKSEVIRENDLICVLATKTSIHSSAVLEEESYKKKKQKNSREGDISNYDDKSGKNEVTQLVNGVQDEMKVKKRKKMQDSSERRKDDEAATLDEASDKMKLTKRKRKHKENSKDKSEKGEEDREIERSESLAETKHRKKMRKDHTAEKNKNEVSRDFTNETGTNESELQASVSSFKELTEFPQIHYKASSQDMSASVRNTTGDESILSNSGVTEVCNEGNTQKKRRRRRQRKKKSGMVTAGDGDSLVDASSGNPTKPCCAMPRNGMLESDRIRNSTQIVQRVHNKSAMPKDETVPRAPLGGHIVFESESDGENDPSKLQPSEQDIETVQSKEMDTSHTAVEVDSMIKPPAEQYKEKLEESRSEDLRIGKQSKGGREAASFNCVTPPEAGEEISGDNTVKITEARKYDTYPPLNGPPRNGDIIAFKILELSSDYCPEVSEYKEGVVTDFDSSTQYVGIQLTKGPTNNREPTDTPEGRFEMELDDEWTTDRNQQKCASQINVLLTSMIEPKLLSV